MSFDIAKIRRARLLAGLSQNALAAKVGLDPSSISILERGLIKGKPETIKKIADTLGLTMEEIFIEEEVA